MKQQTVNEFKDGLNLDLHPLVTPKTVLTDNLNGTFITYNGNEFCLQNDRGNKYVTSLTNGYTPIGIKEHNGILYIVSVNGDKTEIGTFPSPEYENINLENAYREEWKGSLQETYSPLHVLDGHNELTNIDFGYDLEHPVTIEIQDSYDGSVNIIIVADKCKPRIINSGFSVLPDNKYKFVNRKQKATTNIYKDINKESELIRTSDVLTNIDLLGVQAGGQFKGGNYTFYIKFGDGDFNQTDIVAESGIVSIFNGNDGIPSTISGTLLDERTDKMINLAIIGLNPIYSKIYIYYSREYSDTQGFRMTEYGMFNEPIDMVDSENEERFPIGSHTDPVTGTIVTDTASGQKIWLTGFEQTTPIDPEILNVDYHTIDWTRAETQHSNMLFLGNVGNEETFKLYHDLEEYTKNKNNVTHQILQNTVLVDISGNDTFSSSKYYSTSNIYKYVGYWPNEWYRFGIVYILKDGSTTPVFNMTGNIDDNDKGIFKVPDWDVLSTNSPIHFKFTLNNINLISDNVVGWFVVRQKRIPVSICQGLSIGTDKRCYLPVVWDDTNDGTDWYIESFLSLDRTKAEGERWEHRKKDASIYQIEGEPHILRPFLETFDGDKRFYSGFNWDYGVQLTNTKVKKTFSSIYDNETFVNKYDDEKQGLLTGNNLSDSNCIILEEPGLKSIWSDTNEHTLNMWIFSGSVYEKTLLENNKITFTNTPKKLAYLTTSSEGPNELSTYFYDSGTLHIADDNERETLRLISETSFDVQIIKKIDYRFIKETDDDINKNAILSLDPCVNSFVGSMFDGSQFNLNKEYTVSCNINELVFNYNIIEPSKKSINDCKSVFVKENTRSKVLNDNSAFSNVAGTGTSAGDFEYTKVPFGVKTDADGNFLAGYTRTYKKDDRVNDDYGTSDYYGYNSTHNVNLVRGLFTPFIGLDKNLDLGLYTLKRKENGNEIITRKQDGSEYYSVSERLPLNNSSEVYRGDCYICKVGMRILRNFIDNTAPVTNTIVDPLSWERWVRQRSLYGGDEKSKQNGGNDSDSFAAIVDYSEVNLSDLNTVDLGYWVTFPCLSSYNLGLRSIDTFHTDEMALLGVPRSFYPLSGASSINKVGDSYLLNDGFSATVGRKRYNLMPDVPYSKSEFANRIMFSNVNITDAYTNGYRTFQGVSYKDYDKQYGAITKLVSLGQNIFVVMEHGLGLVPVNPKALMQTTTGEAIHIYGYGVLPDEMTIISQDYGSKYEHSVIRTPIGIYGMDVDAKKIWRFSDKQGFETISDMKIESYLNDNLKPIVIQMGLKDIRTHYNGKKGDLMFTWNDKDSDKLYSICYNERQNVWTTRYDWKPVVSENINDEFYSLNDDSIWDHAENVGYDGTYVSSWYGEPHEFEFEFVVSDPIGVNKIFDNLQIISNNVQPKEMEITIIGDDYMFNRKNITAEAVEEIRQEYNHNSQSTSDIHGDKENDRIKTSPYGYYRFDKRLNQSALIKWQPFKDIYKFGRRIGNIQYKEGLWFAQIEPILDPKHNKEVRIRDKWAKIRIRYSGKDLAIITAIKTLINI